MSEPSKMASDVFFEMEEVFDDKMMTFNKMIDFVILEPNKPLGILGEKEKLPFDSSLTENIDEIDIVPEEPSQSHTRDW